VSDQRVVVSPPAAVGVASEHVYSEEDALGVRRLIAAPGQPIAEGRRLTLGMAVAGPPVSAAGVPFDGYDELTEAEVLERMAQLGEDERDRVRAYEQAHRARGTITRYGVQSHVITGARRPDLDVPATSTAHGYESMPLDGEQGLRAEAERRGLEVTPTGSAGRAVKADYVRALQASDAQAASADE
jgi:hypothetical protein